MRVAYVLPPAKTPNEIDMIRSMIDWDVTVIGEVGDRHNCDVELASRRVPVVGDPSHWTAAIAWLRGLPEVELPPIDLVLSLELFSIGSIQAAALARRLDVPHVVISYEVVHRDPVLWFAPPYGIWGHRMLRQADGFLCQTDITEDVLLSRGAPRDRVLTVPSGVDTDLFRPAPQRMSQPVVTFVGELRPDKGILDSISACDLAAPRLGPDFRLVVVGDGELRSHVEGMASTRPWLEIRGKLPRDQVAETLRQSSAFILAPYARLLWSEQLGFASIEAMASGLPVVATRSGAVGTVVPSYNPLAAEHDVETLAKGIELAVGPDGDQWGRDNRDYVLENFSLQVQAEKLSVALKQLMSMPRRRPSRASG